VLLDYFLLCWQHCYGTGFFFQVLFNSRLELVITPSWIFQPVLTVNGSRDTLVGVEEARWNYEAAVGPKNWLSSSLRLVIRGGWKKRLVIMFSGSGKGSC